MMRKSAFVVLLILFILSLSFPGTAQSNNESVPAGGLWLIGTSENSVIVELHTPGFELETTVVEGTTYDVLRVPDYSGVANPGKPQLPVMSTLLGVPPGALVDVQVLVDENEILPGTYTILPAAGPLPLQDDLQPGELDISPDPAIYGVDTVFPAQVARIDGDAWVRDQRIARLELSPFQYNPEQGKLTWHKTLRVEVSFEFQEEPGLFESPPDGNDIRQRPFEGVLKGALLNYNQALSWRGLPVPSSSPAISITGVETTDSGQRYKVVVDQDGLYHLTYEDLVAAGMNFDQVDPATFSLTNQGEEVAIVVGSVGDKFAAGDSIQFYGQKFYGTIMEEKYTDENVYWLTIEDAPGLRMASVDGTPTYTATVPEVYTTTVRAEESNHWWTYHFTGDDTWFWEKVTVNFTDIITDTDLYTYTTALTDIVTQTGTVPLTATVRGEMVAKTYTPFDDNPDHHTKLSLNGQLLLEEFWDGATRYKFDLEVDPTRLQEGVNQLGLTILKAYDVQISDTIFFDWYEIEYSREFRADRDQIEFVGQQNGTQEIDGFTSGTVEILDITDPLKPTRVMSSTLAGGTLAFEMQHNAGTRYYIVGMDAIKKPKSIRATSPTDLKSSTNAYDYVFITHQDFMTATQRLADYRASQGMRTLVVDFNDIVNEFNYGIYNSIAIKHFLAYTFNNWDVAPAYGLLVGDGHWDMKGFLENSPPVYMPPHLAWVDPWQGEVDSTNLLGAVVGEDVLPDVALGRLPVNSVDELNAVINKIMTYESAGLSNPDWRKNVLFVADNTPDSAGDFVAYSEGIIEDYLSSPEYKVDRIYLDDFVDPDPNLCGTPEPGMRSCPASNTAIVDYMTQRGAFLVNYIGHAAVQRWAGEQIFKNTDVPLISNSDRLSVVLSMTCLDGYWIHPQQDSLVSELLRDADSGVVATLSPNGLGVSTGHDVLHRGFYRAIIEDGVNDLGAATLAGKLALYENHYHGMYNDDTSVYYHYDNYFTYDLVNTFTIFGDPALKFQYPLPSLSLPLISNTFP